MVDYLSKYWWVNHKQTFKSEIGGGFLWSPKLKSNGDRNYFYDTMMDAQVGDCVFSYADGKISYLVLWSKKHRQRSSQLNLDQKAMTGIMTVGYYLLLGKR